MKFVLTLALTCFLSPRERTYHRCVPVFQKTVRLIPSHNISKTRRTFPPLLGERAGAREVIRKQICFLRSPPPVSSPSGRGHIITFPHDIPAKQFSFLINYLQYPKNYDLKARSISVVGEALISPEFHPPSKNLVGQKAIFYIPSDDQNYDLVYVRVGDETFENSFAARRWKRVADSRIPAGVEIER